MHAVNTHTSSHTPQPPAVTEPTATPPTDDAPVQPRSPSPAPPPHPQTDPLPITSTAAPALTDERRLYKSKTAMLQTKAREGHREGYRTIGIITIEDVIEELLQVGVSGGGGWMSLMAYVHAHSHSHNMHTHSHISANAHFIKHTQSYPHQQTYIKHTQSYPHHSMKSWMRLIDMLTICAQKKWWWGMCCVHCRHTFSGCLMTRHCIHCCSARWQVQAGIPSYPASRLIGQQQGSEGSTGLMGRGGLCCVSIYVGFWLTVSEFHHSTTNNIYNIY